MYRILVCDDDKEIVRAICIYLEEAGYETVSCYDGLQALEALKKEEIHLVLIDIMMPQLDGLSAIQKIREDQGIPIIVISAKSEDQDKVLGLNIGADDYITKPFNPEELLARVHSQLRRYTKYPAYQEDQEVYRNNGLLVDNRKKLVLVDGQSVELTPLEFDILLLFIKNPGRVFTSEEIYRLIWQEEPYGSEKTVPVHIRHIRTKIEINPKEPRYIKVVWGAGYKMDPGQAKHEQ